MPEPLAEAEDRLIEFYTAQLQARRRSHTVGRRALWVLAGLIVISMFVCGGLVPALFPSETNGGGSNVTSLSCGIDIADVRMPATDLGELASEQVDNVRALVAVGARLGVPPRGWVIAIATALQESKLRNLSNRGAANDYDSVGIFQQRPSQGWGTQAQILNPSYSAEKFYRKLLAVPDWQRMQLTQAAQTVQRSAFPAAYAKWEPLAAHLVLRTAAAGNHTNDRSSPAADSQTVATATPTAAPTVSTATSSAASTAPAAAVNALRSCVSPGEISGSGWALPLHGQLGSGFRTADRPDHQGIDLVAPRGSTIRAAGPGTVIVSGCNASTGNCDVDGGLDVAGCGWYVEIDHGSGTVTRSCHMVAQPVVSVGQRVAAGDPLGEVGSSGNSTGPHLHFETRINGEPVDPTAFLGARGVGLSGKTG
ncbi:MAG: peptidase M23 [Acidimicrobiales bacterium]|nr:MAG: peptidase M23 [Acidimicrobiales bacterium]